MRGQGRSGSPSPGPYTVRMMALDVAAFLRSLDRSEPVHVIGYSLGAAVALQLAVRLRHFQWSPEYSHVFFR
jgi:pimeloyl-ACP methyl ester carboxylesterase